MSETAPMSRGDTPEERWAHTLATTPEGPNPIPVDEDPETAAEYEANLEELRRRAAEKAQRKEGEA